MLGLEIILGGILAAILAAAGAYFAGRRSGHKQGRMEQARNNLETSERMRDANASVDRSRSGVSDRLRGGNF